MSSTKRRRVAVVGAGLVGAMQVAFLAKRGFEVDLYESREDIRIQEIVKGKSINLALSLRGRAALAHIGIEDEVTAEGIPMFARRIHTLDGNLYSVVYGTKEDQYIMSVDRRKLNESLLTAAEKFDTVKMYFKHKLIRCNFDTGEMVFLGPDRQEVTRKADVIFGCDGAFSTVRRQIMRMGRFDYSQMYIPHGYMELTIPPKDNQFAMEVNFLHIWPRNEFMLIALPNMDKTYTCTLFMPYEIFEPIKTETDLMNFWRKHFKDSIPLLGEENIKKTFLGGQLLPLVTVKLLPLVTVKCKPYHYSNTGVILGDAAHAMVPFYGQGMNCGFEDCIVFNELLEQYDNDLKKVLAEFSRIRSPDAQAICDLALYNYIEMRSSVNSRWFLFRKKIDNLLHWLMPNTFVPLYSMVTFSRMRYHLVINKWHKQNKAVNGALVAMLAASLISMGYISWKHAKIHLNSNLHFGKISELVSGFLK